MPIAVGRFKLHHEKRDRPITNDETAIASLRFDRLGRSPAKKIEEGNRVLASQLAPKNDHLLNLQERSRLMDTIYCDKRSVLGSTGISADSVEN